MEALYFFNLWRPTTGTQKQNQPSNGEATEISNTHDDIDEGEDSFFELEFAVPDFDSNGRNSNATFINQNESGNKNHPLECLCNMAEEANNGEQKLQHPTFSLSPNDLLFKRKILPIEPISKPPPSPASLLKSAPRLRVLMFKKSKSMAAHVGERIGDGVSVDAPVNKNQDSKLFAVKFNLKESANVTMFTRENSLKKRFFEEDSSRRFSMEVIQKYLKLIKPLHIKVSKRQSERTKQNAGVFPVVSPLCSPGITTLPVKKEKQGNIPSGIRVVCRHLGKSKSASATNGVMTAMASRRRDDSLLQQHDGIQSAILHCKNSFHSSRESSLLSRFASDPLHEKSMASPRISHEGKCN